MKKCYITFIYLFNSLFCCLTVQLYAAPIYEISENFSIQPVKQHAYLSTDGIRSIDDIIKLEPSLWRNSSESRMPLLNHGDNWLSFEIFNNTAQADSYYLTIINSAKLIEGKVYVEDKNLSVELLSQHSHQANLKTFALSITEYSKVNVFIYVRSDGAQQLNVAIMDSDNFVDKAEKESFIRGVAIGGSIILALMLVGVFLANGSKKVLLLGCYFVNKALLLSVLLGNNLYHFFPYMNEIRAIEVPILTAFSTVFILQFTKKLFKLKSTHPAVVKIISLTCWLLLLYIPVSLFLNLAANILISCIIDLSVSFYLIALGITLIKMKRRLATLFTVIMAIQLTCYLIILWLNNTEFDFFTSRVYVYSFSFWVHGLLFSFLLNRESYYQIKDRQVEQELARESAMASQKAQDELLMLQEDSQEQLEVRVQERTLELNIALQELGDVNKELAEKNTRDELSGLYNRRFYDQKILAEYRRSRRNLTPLSIVIIDIDHFKVVNDSYGHLAGDQCIVAVAQKIKEGLGRSSDVACRYGGEEFCLILPETDTKGAIALAEELRIKMSDLVIKYNNKVIKITVSAGVSTYQQQVDISTEHLFSAADKALYIAKEQGRNQVQQLAITDCLT